MASSSKHHVPPRCYHEPDMFIIKGARCRHRAYHDLLGIPRSYKEACDVLAVRYREREEGRLSKPLKNCFQLLFPYTKSYEEAAQTLVKDWWTPRKKK